MNTDIAQNQPEIFFRGTNGLETAKDNVARLTVFIGLDGFVDEILHVVDKRESVDNFTRVPSIERLAGRLAGAVCGGTNLELVNAQTKLGGNGPIMANALAGFGLKVTYLGALGYPAVHPVFADFVRKVQAYSIAQPDLLMPLNSKMAKSC